MENVKFDENDILIDIMTDYIDGNLNNGNREQFEQFLEQNPERKQFINKAIRGRYLLQTLSRRDSFVADNFEGKLALEMALENSETVKTDYH